MEFVSPPEILTNVTAGISNIGNHFMNLRVCKIGQYRKPCPYTLPITGKFKLQVLKVKIDKNVVQI